MTNEPGSSAVNDRLAERATLFLEPAVIEVLSAVYGCEPLPLGLAHRGQSIHGFRIRRPFTDRVVLAPFNFQPIFRDRGEEIVEAIIAAARASGPRTSAVIRLHHRLADGVVARAGLAHAADCVETLLPLASGPDAVVAAFSQNQRRRWRKSVAGAERAAVRVRRFRDLATMRRLYGVLLKAYRDKHRMMPQPLLLFERLLSLPEGTRSCHGYVAEIEGRCEPAGGIVVTCDETQWSYGWGANDATYEHLGLGTLLVGTAMLDAAQAGIPVFSFGVSPLTHESLRAFKRNWGAEEHLIHAYYRGERPRPVDLHRDFALAKRVVAMTPLPVLKAISPLAVRWLV